MSTRSQLLAFSMGLALLADLGPIACAAEDAAPQQLSPALANELGDLSAQYQKEVLPLAQKFCHECHSQDAQEGDLDLARFKAIVDVRRSPEVFKKVADMLDAGEMPPKDAAQPSPDERRRLRDWVGRYLKFEARAGAGDPGPVVLRRLSNVEYENSVRALTGVDLKPAESFPVDGAAGEGFTNSGEALVMSPALLDKYLTAAKDIAAHAVLLPDGVRFSPSTTSRDWTDEVLAQIRALYAEYADSKGNIPWQAYLGTLVEHREAIAKDPAALDRLAAERKLSAPYLRALWDLSNRDDHPPLLADFCRRIRGAKPDEVPALVAELNQWQQSLTKFNPVGYFKAWQEPVNPVQVVQSFRVKLAPAAAGDTPTVYLAATDFGDGGTGDLVLWQRPRLEIAGCPPLLLRDVGALVQLRKEALASTHKYLEVAAAAMQSEAAVDARGLAPQHNVDADVLADWLAYLGIASTEPAAIAAHLTTPIKDVGGNAQIHGWGTLGTPCVLANASDKEARIPGTMKPRTIAVHPAPNVQVSVAWRSPIKGTVRIEAAAADAHPECGNGVTWAIDRRRGAARERLAEGAIDTGGTAKIGPIDGVSVGPGDVVCLLIGPRGDHGCDLTRVDLTIQSTTNPEEKWNVTEDTAGSFLAANPHADRQNRPDVWHFHTEAVTEGAGTTVTAIGPPAGSLLDRWRAAAPAERDAIASQLQKLLEGPAPAGDTPDAALVRQIASLSGPLFSRIDVSARATPSAPTDPAKWGLDPARFGKTPSGQSVDAASIAVQAPSVLEVRLPTDLVVGRELVVDGRLVEGAAGEGSVQLLVGQQPPASTNRPVPATPILVRDGGEAKKRIEAGLAEFRRWFPAAMCFAQIVPIDEVVTVELFHRDDEPLARLMLDERQRARLDRLWEELRYVSHDAFTVQEGYEQYMEYATQDRNPADYEPLRKPINQRVAQFQQQLLDTEPAHLASVLELASTAYRRPLSHPQEDELRQLYAALRKLELPHDEAIRTVLARVLIAPEFLYRIEQPSPGAAAKQISDWEMASRLSYFLWAAPPDDALRRAASAGELSTPDQIAAQARRLLADDRVRGLATEFACQWIGVRDFEQLDEKSERHFPTFVALRGAMYEESVRFFVDLFQRDGSVLQVIDADYTFLNEQLAAHYGIPNVTGPEWRRVDGVRPFGRGGILGLATTLSKQSGASRTSPILRGNWVVETLLGEKLPKPPKNVPPLPADEAATEGLTVRQLVEKHRSIESCAKCHVRIDPFGFALEKYDAIGRLREKDLGDRPIDVNVSLADGTQFAGLEGLRDYLLNARREAFLRNFCRKLLGYALGRSVQLSDEPLLDQMLVDLKQHDYRFSAAVESIVRSEQFRFHRGLAEPEATQPLNE